MPESQPEDAPGRAETFASHPEAAELDAPTLYEFLTRIVTSPDARSAFEADPRAMLDQAGLGDMSATDVLQATSLVLDYAPVEVADEYGRSLQSTVEKFAPSTQHVAISEMHPAHPHEQEVTDLSMLHNHSPAPAPSENENENENSVHVEHNDTDSHNLINIHDVASGNDIASGNGSSEGGDLVGNVGNTVNNTVGNVAGDLPVDDLTGALPTAGAGAEGEAGPVSGVAGGAVDTVGGAVSNVPVAGDVAEPAVNAVGGVAGGAVGTVEGAAGGAVDTVGGVAGGAVGGPVADVASNLPVPAPADLPVVGDVAQNLPVDDVASHLPAPSDLPVAGPIAGGAVEDVTGAAHQALPLDGIL